MSGWAEELIANTSPLGLGLLSDIYLKLENTVFESFIHFVLRFLLLLNIFQMTI